jgi:predicted ester cyclase
MTQTEVEPMAQTDIEHNIEVSRRVFEEIINEGKLEVAEEVVTPTTRVVVPFTHPGHGVSGLQKIASSLRGGFPDIHIELEDIIAVDDKVALRWKTTRQTHTGMYRGLPPTGKEVRITGMAIFHFENGKIEEFWLELDQLNGARQMGAVAPEHYEGPRLALFVLGSVFRMGFLTAKYQITKGTRKKQSQVAGTPG